MTALFLGLAAVYLAVMGALAWLVARQAAPAARVPDDALPTLAVVVAARDEEATLARCLDALVAQDYPRGKLDVVVADDHSRDGTAAVAARYAAAGVRLVTVPAADGPLLGKANALHAAVEGTADEVLLVTDADCAPPPTWARTVAARFTDPAVGVSCGMSRIAPRPGRPFDRAQAVDWALMIAATAAVAEAGRPATGMGNNMAVRRAAYRAVGGYPALPFSVTEDYTLVRAVADQTDWRVEIRLDAASTVWTLPAEGLGHAYAQRRRWARGGLAGGPLVWATYAVLFAVHTLPLAGLAVAPAGALAFLAAKLVGDGWLVGAALRRTGPPLRWRDLPLAEAFLFLYLTTLPAVLLLRPRIGWKGRQH